MVIYVHGQPFSWTWGCKPQSDASQIADNVHMVAQTVMGESMAHNSNVLRIVCVTPGATHNITSNDARMGMPAILPIAGHTMRSISRTPMKDKARKLDAPPESIKWSMREFERFRKKNVFRRRKTRILPLRCGSPYASPEVAHRPRSQSPLHFDIYFVALGVYCPAGQSAFRRS